MANCPKRQYDLAGLASRSAQSTCPECGETIPELQAHASPSYKQRLLGFASPQLPALICIAWLSLDALLDEAGGGWGTLSGLLFVYPLLAVVGVIAGSIMYHERSDKQHLSTLELLVPTIILHVLLVYAALRLPPIHGS